MFGTFMDDKIMTVAAYCRVSTDSYDQANSLESQQKYFDEFIKRNPLWEMYEIYVDEGISGTNTKKRDADKIPNQIQNPVQSYETGQAGQRSRESVSRDLDKARKLLSEMKRNSDRDKSNVDKVIYQRMIQRQEEKIRELEQELEKLDQ